MFQPLVTYPGVTLAIGGDLAVAVWAGEASSTLEANRWAIRTVRLSMLERWPKGLVLQVISQEVTPPSVETRKYIQQEFTTLMPRVRRFVTVPLGDSFKQSVVRTIMRGMIVLSGASSVSKVVSTVDEGLDSIYEVATPNTPPRPETIAIVQAMMAAAGAR